MRTSVAVRAGASGRSVFLWYAGENTSAPPVHAEWLEERLEHPREIPETPTADRPGIPRTILGPSGAAVECRAP